MNFQNLQYFLAVAEEMNVTKAAKRLHISEQALSRQIGKLETELSCKLFERNPRFTLSPAGKRLKAAAEQIGNIERQLHLELDDLTNNNTGELRLGVSYTRGQALLPRLLPPFHQKHPGITVTILEGSASELQENLTKGRIDLFIGYVPRDLDAFEAAELGRERLFLVVPKTFMEDRFGAEADDMRRRFSGGVDILAFKDMPFILLDRDDRVRRMADRLFSRYDITPGSCWRPGTSRPPSPWPWRAWASPSTPSCSCPAAPCCPPPRPPGTRWTPSRWTGTWTRPSWWPTTRRNTSARRPGTSSRKPRRS